MIFNITTEHFKIIFYKILFGLFYICLLYHFNLSRADCPSHKSTFSMIYPAKFIFISEDNTVKEPYKIPLTLIKSIWNSLQKKAPKFIFVGTTKTFAEIKNRMHQQFDQKTIEENLILLETKPALFQQDVFESFFSSEDNSVIIRNLQGYLPIRKGPDLSSLVKILNTHGIKSKNGKTIDQYEAWLTGVGGNIESTSFGINMLGSGEFSNSSFQKFASDVFMDKNVIKFDTSWLALGHVDEILVEIKVEKKSSKCESTFLINSPRMGIQYDSSINSEAREINNQLQKKYDVFKETLKKEVKNHNSCKINFIDVPILYNKVGPEFKKNVFKVVYPPLVNGLLLGDHYFVVDPMNLKVKKVFEDLLKKINTTVVWVPLHKELYSNGVVDGFLHCLTNTIRTCN